MGLLSRHLSMLALATVLAACGGPISGGGLPSFANVGVFVDSAVVGLGYESGNHRGVTEAGGLFAYEIGGDVTFSVGDIVLGTGPAQTVMTPVSLVPGATDENNQAVTNIAWFLLALDDDGNPANGIFLSEDVRDFATGSVDFNVSALDFLSTNATLVSALTGGHSLASVTGVKAHLRDTLLATMAGTYEATAEGDDTGTMSMTLAASGGLTGTAVFDGFAGGTQLSLFGAFKSDRSAAFSASGGTTLEGTVHSDGTFDGTWTRTTGASGTFSGRRTAA